MKQWIAAIVFSALATAPAMAADMGVSKPAPEPVYNWTGLYIGGSIGWLGQFGDGTSNFSENCFNCSLSPDTNSPSANSFVGGAQIGYNWQVTPRWVFGLEGDWQWTRPKYNFCRRTDNFSIPCADNGAGFLTIDSQTKWIATARGRVGLTVDRFMLYATGGAAWVNVQTSIVANCLVNGCGASLIPSFNSADFSDTKVGWAAGFGFEGMLSPNWTARAEWLHVGIGSFTNTLTFTNADVGAQSASWSRAVRYDIIRVGINYHFGGLLVGTR